MNIDTQSKLRLLLFTLGTAAFASFSVPGCSTQADELCDIQCECQRCSDRARDECGIIANANEDRASIYGCESEYNEYIQCALDDNDCDDNSFSIDNSCDDEEQDLFECVADNSDIIGNSSGSNGSGSGGGNPEAVLCNCTCTCNDNPAPMTIMDQTCVVGGGIDCTCQALCDAGCSVLGGTASAEGGCQ